MSRLRWFRDNARDKGQKEGDFTVQIRADHRVDYVQVEPVIAAAMVAEIPKMNIGALLAGNE